MFWDKVPAQTATSSGLVCVCSFPAMKRCFGTAAGQRNAHLFKVTNAMESLTSSRTWESKENGVMRKRNRYLFAIPPSSHASPNAPTSVSSVIMEAIVIAAAEHVGRLSVRGGFRYEASTLSALHKCTARMY